VDVLRGPVELALSFKVVIWCGVTVKVYRPVEHAAARRPRAISFLPFVVKEKRNMKAIPRLVAAVALLSVVASVSSAQSAPRALTPAATLVARAFVSGGGSDTNPCSLTAPCRTFAAALALTESGGEVVVLDSAGYGPFSITQAVTVQAAPGAYAGITVTSGDGVDISAGVSATVILRGLTFSSQGTSGNGIVLNSAAILHVESCIVNGFTNGLTGGTGLEINGHGNVEVKDCIFRGNDQGISVQPTSGTALVTIDHCRLEASPSHNGLFAGDGSSVTVRNSIASANFQSGFVVSTQSSRAAELNIENCIASNNMGNGISVVGLGPGTSTARVSDSTITDNAGTGLMNSGSPAVLTSRKNNSVEGNLSGATSGTIGSFTAQ
jgi:hypothetical protein